MRQCCARNGQRSPYFFVIPPRPAPGLLGAGIWSAHLGSATLVGRESRSHSDGTGNPGEVTLPPRPITPKQELQALAQFADLQELLALWAKIGPDERDLVLMLMKAMIEVKRQ